MIPPRIQGWLFLHRARLRDQDIFGVTTTTGGSLNVKLVEKSLLDLFTDDVLESVDRSLGKDSGNPRKQHASEAIEEIPEDDDETHLNDDYSEDDDPYVDEDGTLLATEDVVSDVNDDLAIDDEEYHEALLGYREARDLMKKGSRCSWILPCCCHHPFRQAYRQRKKVNPQVARMCRVARLVVARVEEDRKVLDDCQLHPHATQHAHRWHLLFGHRKSATCVVASKKVRDKHLREKEKVPCFVGGWSPRQRRNDSASSQLMKARDSEGREREGERERGEMRRDAPH